MHSRDGFVIRIVNSSEYLPLQNNSLLISEELVKLSHYPTWVKLLGMTETPPSHSRKQDEINFSSKNQGRAWCKHYAVA